MSSPWQVVEDFEAALRGYCGAPYAVALSSATAGLLLALMYQQPNKVLIPRHTYISVPLAAKRAYSTIQWSGEPWTGCYRLAPTNIWDCALRFTSGMYEKGQIQVVSFAAAKILGMEQGGAILPDTRDADLWFRKMRFDGRTPGKEVSEDSIDVLGYHFPMLPSVAAQGILRLHHLPKNNPDQVRQYPDVSVHPIFQ